jgi:hypothetical protein
MSFSFSNTYNTYKVWGITLPTQPYWVGAKIKGGTSGATGIITQINVDFGGTPTQLAFLQTSVTNFTGLEYVYVVDSVFTADPATNQLTAGITYATGTSFQVFTSTGTSVLPSPLAAGTTYYAIYDSPTTMKIATSYANATTSTGIYIDITSTGIGTHTMYRGSFRLRAAAISTTTYDTIMVSGTDDYDTTANLSYALGDVGENGGKYVTTIGKNIEFKANSGTELLLVGETFTTGECIRVKSSNTLPSPLVANTNYYARYVSATTIRLCETYAKAIANDYINLSNVGTGIHAIYKDLPFTANTSTNQLSVLRSCPTGTSFRVHSTSTGTLPTPLAVNTDYYAILVTPVTTSTGLIKIATTYANATTSTGIALTLTSTGVGTHTIYLSSDYAGTPASSYEYNSELLFSDSTGVNLDDYFQVGGSDEIVYTSGKSASIFSDPYIGTNVPCTVATVLAALFNIGDTVTVTSAAGTDTTYVSNIVDIGGGNTNIYAAQLTLDHPINASIMALVSTDKYRPRRGEFNTPIFADAPALPAGTELYRLTLGTTVATGMKAGGIYRIDSEYIYTIYPAGGTTLWFVRRGLFNSEIVEHATGADIYALNEDFLYQCYKASVDNGWGYDSVVDGIMQLDCIIILGTPDQTSTSMALSANEALVQTYSTLAVGNNATDHVSVLYVGKGKINDAKTACEGSLWRCIASDTKGIANGLASTKFGKVHRFASTFECTSDYDGGSIQKCIVFGNASTKLTLLQYQGNESFDGSDTTYWNDVLSVGFGLNPSGARIEFARIIVTDSSYGFYFLYGFASPIIWDAQVINVATQDAFAFVDAGDKIFVNSEVDVFNMAGFWAAPTYYDKRTIDTSAITSDGVSIPGVSVKIWDAFGTLVVDGLTGVDGTIVQQLVTIKTNALGSATLTSYNPFKIVVTKKGWKDKDFIVNISEALVYEFVMENPGLVEDEN